MYLKLAALQYENQIYEGAYNVGPNDSDCLQTEQLVQLFCKYWNQNHDGNLVWETQRNQSHPHEANLLRLDCRKIKQKLDWKPVWDIQVGMEKTVEWYAAYLSQKDMCTFTTEQILAYMENMKNAE